jgi:hypothetical protein
VVIFLENEQEVEIMVSKLNSDINLQLRDVTIFGFHELVYEKDIILEQF